MNSMCPECDRYLTDASSCKCGWKRPQMSAPVRAGSYRHCDWLAGTEQCRYPGSMSTNTREGGPYFCNFHFGCDDASYGAQIVEASRSYKHPTQDELMAEHNQRALKSLEEKGLSQRPDETKPEWRKRMIKWLRENMTGIVKRAA